MEADKKILSSWQANAGSWIELIDSGGPESRRLVTNQAIVDAVIGAAPATVLDLGCGEGWLSEALYKQGLAIWGVDAIPALVEKANSKIPGRFRIATYEELAAGQVHFDQLFDVIVINFALIGKESTEDLLRTLPALLSQQGRLLIQTLHPHTRKESGDYVSGWKDGSWDGLGDRFVQPYQWYFRTLEDWLRLFDSCGFGRVGFRDTVHPVSGRLLSVIFDCRIH